jgi:hypothetical protein
LNLTVTPGSIVNITPLLTNKLFVIIYGLPDFVHVVFAEITPLTLVSALALLKDKIIRNKKDPVNF